MRRGTALEPVTAGVFDPKPRVCVFLVYLFLSAAFDGSADGLENACSRWSRDGLCVSAPTRNICQTKRSDWNPSGPVRNLPLLTPDSEGGPGAGPAPPPARDPHPHELPSAACPGLWLPRGGKRAPRRPARFRPVSGGTQSCPASWGRLPKSDEGREKRSRVTQADTLSASKGAVTEGWRSLVS